MTRLVILMCHLLVLNSVLAQGNSNLSADEIMSGVFENLKMEKYIYEEISVILTDQAGNRDTRQLRKFTRINDDDVIKFLLVFDEPEDYEGVALLAMQERFNEPDISVYLPASGELLRLKDIWNDNEGIFGMDFTLSQISRVITADYQYRRRDDRKIGNVTYYIIDAYESNADTGSSPPLMQHMIRHDRLYITRTNFYDSNGRVVKQLTLHNLMLNSEQSWIARMQYMVNRIKRHSTLIKINRRIISDDYVSDDVFTENWLMENKPPQDLSPTDQEQLEIELIDASINHPDNPAVTYQVGDHR